MLGLVGKVREDSDEKLSTELRSKGWVGVEKVSSGRRTDGARSYGGKKPLRWCSFLMTFKVLFFLKILFIYWMGNMFWNFETKFKSRKGGSSLLVQWLRIRLPMKRTWVRALVQEDATCHRATKPVRHNYWACTLEPVSHNYRAREPQLLSPCATTTEAHVPRARALQQEKPPQWEARTLQQRVAPARRN